MSGPAAATRSSRRVPVLAYHVIGRGRSPLEISPERFRAHMASLYNDGWCVLTEQAFLEGLRRGSWPARSVLLTFDDATVSFAEHALPVLVQYGLTAVLFAVSGRLGAAADWPGWPAGVDGRLMDGPALRNAATAGIAIGAHSITHRSLARLSPAEAEREILGSRADMEGVIERRVRTFAYPYGDAPAWALNVVRGNYEAAFGIGLSDATGRSRPELVDRIDAYYLREWSSLATLERPSARLWLGVRALARRARRAASASYARR
jgi:peptidoglycan/xylan/chitin deacetylase (PgdA/CDA1 family)